MYRRYACVFQLQYTIPWWYVVYFHFVITNLDAIQTSLECGIQGRCMPITEFVVDCSDPVFQAIDNSKFSQVHLVFLHSQQQKMQGVRSGDLLGHDGGSLWPVQQCHMSCPGSCVRYGCNGQVSCLAESSYSQWLTGGAHLLHVQVHFSVFCEYFCCYFHKKQVFSVPQMGQSCWHIRPLT
jgi:hypothetical protein